MLLHMLLMMVILILNFLLNLVVGIVLLNGLPIKSLQDDSRIYLDAMFSPIRKVPLMLKKLVLVVKLIMIN